MSGAPKISVVAPVYQAKECVDELCARLTAALKAIGDSYEIILVDDRSTDGSWEQVQLNAKKDAHIKAARLSRNFGQHQAITAGLSLSQGEWVCVMDCDLQHPPEAIGKMLAKAKEGFDIVYARQSDYKTGLFKKLTSKIYHGVVGLLTSTPSGEFQGRFTLMSRKVVDSFLRIHDYYRDYLVLLRWMGFSVASIDVPGSARFKGRSSYTWGRMFTHAVDGIISQSNILLRLSIHAGLLAAGGAAIYSLWIVYNKIVSPGVPLGWSSVMTAVVFFGGLIMISQGIVGIYIEKIFFQTKQRPIFILDQKINL